MGWTGIALLFFSTQQEKAESDFFSYHHTQISALTHTHGADIYILQILIVFN